MTVHGPAASIKTYAMLDMGSTCSLDLVLRRNRSMPLKFTFPHPKKSYIDRFKCGGKQNLSDASTMDRSRDLLKTTPQSKSLNRPRPRKLETATKLDSFGKTKLPNNRSVAESHLRFLERRIVKNPVLAKRIRRPSTPTSTRDVKKLIPEEAQEPVECGAPMVSSPPSHS